MLYNTTLEAVDSAKYLGVTLTTDLRFNRHIDNIRKNASGTLEFLKRNLRISSSEVKTQAYQSYVRPRLEYAASFWDPFTKTNKDKLEMVQRYSAHWTLGRYHNRSSVTDMFNYLGWRSLEMRCVDPRMSMMYKMSNGLVAVDTTSYLVHPAGIAASAHPHHFIVPRTFNQLHLNSFFPRSVRQWNALPDTVAQAPSLESFKQRVCQINHSA